MDEFCFCRQERMEELLCDAALRGDLQSLHDIIAKDNYILDKVLAGFFKGKNPLHLATLKRQAKFVQELLKIEPKLAEVVDTKLGAALHIASANGDLQIVEALVEHSPEMCMARDRNGNNPLHIASANGHLKIVEALVKVNPEMCMARDRDGNNPLHIAAMKGNVEVLEKLVRTCPLAAQVVLDRGDTILHLCVNYNQLKSLRLLLDKIIDPDFVHSKDANGNTILHIAVSRKRYEIVKYVIHKTEINWNATNRAGSTARDLNFFVRDRGHKEAVDDRIENLLRKIGASRSRYMMVVSPPVKGLLETIMVVASLFATMAFQVGVNPPCGVWQEDGKDHQAGESVFASKHPVAYRNFMFFNTVGFLMSLAAILVLLILAVPFPKTSSGWILPFMSLLTILTTAYAYTKSVIVLSPKHLNGDVTYYSFAVLMAAFLMLLGSKEAFERWRTKKHRERTSGSSPPNAEGENTPDV